MRNKHNHKKNDQVYYLVPTLISCQFLQRQHNKNKSVHSSYVCTNISVADENQP